MSESRRISFDSIYDYISTSIIQRPFNKDTKVLTDTEMYYKLKEFVQKYKPEYPMFPWLALFIAYSTFFKKYGNLHMSEIDNVMISVFIEIGLMPDGEGLKNVYIHTLFNDLILIHKTSFDNFLAVLLARIAVPLWDRSWINDLYVYAETYRVKHDMKL